MPCFEIARPGPLVICNIFSYGQDWERDASKTLGGKGAVSHDLPYNAIGSPQYVHGVIYRTRMRIASANSKSTFHSLIARVYQVPNLLLLRPQIIGTFGKRLKCAANVHWSWFAWRIATSPSEIAAILQPLSHVRNIKPLPQVQRHKRMIWSLFGWLAR